MNRTGLLNVLYNYEVFTINFNISRLKKKGLNGKDDGICRDLDSFRTLIGLAAEKNN